MHTDEQRGWNEKLKFQLIKHRFLQSTHYTEHVVYIYIYIYIRIHIHTSIHMYVYLYGTPLPQSLCIQSLFSFFHSQSSPRDHPSTHDRVLMTAQTPRSTHVSQIISDPPDPRRCQRCFPVVSLDASSPPMKDPLHRRRRPRRHRVTEPRARLGEQQTLLPFPSVPKPLSAALAGCYQVCAWCLRRSFAQVLLRLGLQPWQGPTFRPWRR